jgi:riboflavin kinase/FMN adenylyltransferase
MLNIGTNPTVNGDKLTVEVYILDFNEDIYGEEIVKFRDFLKRNKFESLEKLIELDEDKNDKKNLSFNFTNAQILFILSLI